MRRFTAVAATAALLGVACRTETAEQHAPVQAGRALPVSAFDPETWRPPADSEIPGDSLGASIRRGRALFLHTADSLPSYVPAMTCGNCHLDGGRRVDAIPLTGTHARYPRYLGRTGAVVALSERVNYCFTRSLAGSRLPPDSREMQDMLAYIAWLSRGVPVGEGEKLPGAHGLAAMPAGLSGDARRGEEVYARFCAACHQPDGQGNRALHPPAPALWGARSFSVGASMTREGKAASFIWHNMPLGAGKSLTPQQAFDVAAYISSKPRPDSPGKENDWPRGGAPHDVPYATSGHAAYRPPPLLPRANPAAALVPAPRRAQRPAGGR